MGRKRSTVATDVAVLVEDLLALKRADRPAFDALILLLVRMVERKSTNGRTS